MQEIIEKFYHSFSQLQAEDMVSCYHDEIEFEDPAFGKLKGTRAGNMWRMLAESQKGKEFKIEYRDIQVSGSTGKVHWEAFYVFSQTGRKVHNIIEATFEFKEGRIYRHKDHFNLYRWSKQALGLKGYLLGWTPYFKNQFNILTNKTLDRYEKTRVSAG